ncbi:MAG: bifunctional diaminohydroxyphosphoribosylaminopyrimidine deaminase/5-amino-6-(5-phosphoribosylamino)uracil reductase RibD [Acidimicrobiales bacterium]
MDDRTLMDRALASAASVQGVTAPNPWVGCALISSDGVVVDGRTHPPGGDHAEADALRRAAEAGVATRGSTMVVTLEPCSHHGRTPPCTDAIVDAGVARVVVAIEDPDPRVAGSGIGALRAAGVDVTLGVGADLASDLLAPYLHQRRTGRPWVVVKLAATLDGRTAAPDGSSRWITGEEARHDVHRLRARSDAILVGAGTVRADDPSLTVRGVDPPWPDVSLDPLRVVLGEVPPGAAVAPAVALTGSLLDVLDDLGRRGVLQLMVEGGPTVAAAFHAQALVDRYVLYLAPALFGGDDARPVFAGEGVATIDDLWRGRIVSLERLGDDIRVELAPRRPTPTDPLHRAQEAPR